jgi:N utilization substance protein B
MSDENKTVEKVPVDNTSSQSGVAPGSKGMAKARGKSRRLAMQAIYQWQMTGDNITDIKQQFFDENNFTKIDLDYFSELVSGVAGSISELDPQLEKYMTRLIESVDPVERAILRIAAYEFVNRLDVPYRVVLNEAISITKEFCAENSHTFVNAVLDKVAKEVRDIEVQADSKSRPVSKPKSK